MAKIDFHVHSCFSIDSLTSISSIYNQAKKAGLNGLALTDHNEFRGVAAFNKLLKEKDDKDFLLVPGTELKIDKGEILAFFLQEQVKSRTLEEVVDEAKQQDALLCLPHPFDTVRRVVPKINEITTKQLKAIDAIEVFNARNLYQESNQHAKQFALKHIKAMVAGSDSHWWFEIGRTYTEVQGQTLEEVKKEIKKKKTKVYGTPANAAVLALTKIVKTLKPLITKELKG